MRALIGMVLLCAAGAASADWTDTLQARDFNADGSVDGYYDTAQNITWLGDANYAATIHLFEGEYRSDGFKHAPGPLSWVEATAWAPTVDLSGVTGWRLPVSFVPDGAICSPLSSACRYDSELSSLYDVLQGSTGPFENVAIDPGGVYLTGNKFASLTGVNRFAYFRMTDGLRGSTDETTVIGAYAWLVHDGDVGASVSPVPEPSTYALMLAGLAAVGFMVKRWHLA